MIFLFVRCTIRSFVRFIYFCCFALASALSLGCWCCWCCRCCTHSLPFFIFFFPFALRLSDVLSSFSSLRIPSSQHPNEHRNMMRNCLLYCHPLGIEVELLTSYWLISCYYLNARTYFRIVAHASAWTHTAKPVALGMNIDEENEMYARTPHTARIGISEFCGLRRHRACDASLCGCNFYRTNGMSCVICQWQMSKTKRTEPKSEIGNYFIWVARAMSERLSFAFLWF